MITIKAFTNNFQLCDIFQVPKDAFVQIDRVNVPHSVRWGDVRLNVSEEPGDHDEAHVIGDNGVVLEKVRWNEG